MRGGACVVLHGWLGRQVVRLRRAFGRLPAPELLLFAGPKRSSQEKWPYGTRRPYKPWRLRRFGTCVAPPVRPSATPRRRRQLRSVRGCGSLPCFAFSNGAEPLHSRFAVYSPHRHSGAGRRRFSTDEGLVIQWRRWAVVAKTRRSRYWAPACAGMTGGNGSAFQQTKGRPSSVLLDALASTLPSRRHSRERGNPSYCPGTPDCGTATRPAQTR